MIMKTNKNMVKVVLMSILTAVTFSFTACSDDEIERKDTFQPQGNTPSESLEAYGLTFETFISENDVTILNADSTQISVSKAYADKMGISTFVGHPMGIWHKVEQLPYIRKATAEQLVGDRYILTVQPATVAEIIGDKKVELNTGIYVNHDAKDGDVTRADGTMIPGYAAKYMDQNNVLHPAVIHMTDPYGYDKGYHVDGDLPMAQTRADGGFQYVTAEELDAESTRASARRNILSFNSKVAIDKDLDYSGYGDKINVNAELPIDFDLNYFITLDGGVKWHFVIPEPYVQKFEAGVDGKFAFTPQFKLGFKKEWKIDDNKMKLILASFSGYTFTFWVGPVPVVIKCDPNLYLKLDGKVSGAVDFGFKYEYENEFKAGVRYTDGNGWGVIGDFKEVKNEFSLIKPEMEVHGELGVGLYLGLDVMIYGVAGPEVAIGPRLGGEFTTTFSPFESLKPELEAEVKMSVNATTGAKLKVLGYELAEWSHTFQLAGPWTLFKYPSDGSEHKSPAAKKSDEGKDFIKAACQNYSNMNLSATYTELVDMLAQMERKTNDEKENELIADILKPYNGNVPTCDRKNSQYVYDYITKMKDETEPKYKQWCIDENWRVICKAVEENEQAKIMEKTANDDTFLLGKALNLSRRHFIAEYGREPSQSTEDLQCIANMVLNYRDLVYDATVELAKQDPAVAKKMQENPELINRLAKELRDIFKAKFSYSRDFDDPGAVKFVVNYFKVRGNFR